MANSKSKLFLTLSAIALLGACDDNGSSSSNKTGWFDWLKAEEPRRTMMIGQINSPDYAIETLSGNYLSNQFAQYRQDWSQANSYLDKVISYDPKNLELQQRSMILSMQAGDSSRSIGLARKVLKEDEKNVLALLFIGMDDIKRQDYNSALKTLQKMPSNGIADFIKPILIAWANAPDGKVDDETLVNTSALHAYHALLIADHLGKVKDPERYFLNILGTGGVDGHTLEMVADAFSRQGATEYATKIYDSLIKQSQMSNVLSTQINELTDKRDNPQLAQSTRIMTPAEGAAEAFFNMARILYQDKSDESALVFARLSQYLAPADEDTKLLMARILMRNDHVDEAIKIYQSIKSESTTFLEAQRSAAELMEEEGRLEESIAYLESIYADHKDVNALIQIGDTYRRAEKFDLAIKAYDRAANAIPGDLTADHWNLFYARGMSYERAGNFKKAEADLMKAMEYKPEHPYLLNYLGYSWADQGKNLEKALELIIKAAALRPDDGYITDSLGWVYYQMGDYNNAVTELERAIELVPYDSTINDHLGDAYWKVGRKHEARFQWQRALNHDVEEKLKPVIQAKIENGLTDGKSSLKQTKTVSTPAGSAAAQ
jgi:tetratricopeptide (TPR) repeat protein